MNSARKGRRFVQENNTFDLLAARVLESVQKGGATMKRCVDILVALVLLILFSPILCCVSLLTLAFNGWPIVFSQTRPGLHGKLFTLYKFRSMKTGEGLRRGSIDTPFGKLLRKSSLDELPQLWNVLGGDMSLVGPRPLLEQYLSLYTHARQARRHDVTAWGYWLVTS